MTLPQSKRDERLPAVQDRIAALESLIVQLDATFAEMDAARRKGYLRRDLALLRAEADKILAVRRMAPPLVGGRAMSTEKVRELNDAFRKSFAGGKVVMTASVAELPDMVRANALVEVSRFDRFTEDNDPHGEHDFGSFEMVGRKFFWKLDYYDSTMEFGSEDPSDPEKTTRVLTLMLAEDY